MLPLKRNTTQINERIITEGKTRFCIPDYRDTSGPGTADMIVFYNPVMSLNRDFSVLFFSSDVEIKKGLDGLAATGARGIRVKNETDHPVEMHLNDHSPVAESIMMKNAKENDVSVTIHRENLNTLLSSQYFDYIDIDPFGSPVDFIPMAIRSVRNRGYLAITATDTGALCGSYPKACLRRYGFHNIKGSFLHETGVRGLISHVIREAAKFDRYVNPVLTQSLDHYYRIHFQVFNGARKADKMLQELSSLPKFYGVDPSTESGYPTFINRSDLQDDHGPFYIGPLHQRKLLDSMIKSVESATIHNPERAEKLLNFYLDECDQPAFYYETDRISKHLKCSTPSMDSIFSSLADLGFSTARTQFSPTGFKTNAPYSELRSIFLPGGERT